MKFIGLEMLNFIMESFFSKNKTSFNEVSNAVEKYTKFVLLMKLLLPGFAIIILLSVIIIPFLNSSSGDISENFLEPFGSVSDRLSLMNARYFGVDQSGQKFSITANTASESEIDKNKIILKSPQADISLKNGTWLMVSAESGEYNRKQSILNLKGDVSLFQDEGYEMHTDTATLFIESGSGKGDRRINAQGSFGQLTSQGFKFTNKGDIFFFKGPSKLILNPSGDKNE